MRSFALAFSLLVIATSAFGSRQLIVNIPAVNAAELLFTNVGNNAQRITVTFAAEGNFALSPTTVIGPPNMTCTGSPGTCRLDPYVLGVGKSLWTTVNVAHVPPYIAQSGLKATILIDEDRGAVTAAGFSQIIYNTGPSNQVYVNLPMPVMVNGGRPF